MLHLSKVKNVFKGKANPIPNDILASKRHECFAFHAVLGALKEDLKACGPAFAGVAQLETHSTNLAKSLVDGEAAVWDDFEAATKHYSEAHAALHKHYEFDTKLAIETLYNAVETQFTKSTNVIKKIENRDQLHARVMECEMEVTKTKNAGKSTSKVDANLEKAKMEFSKSTDDVLARLEDLLADRKQFLASSLKKSVEIQMDFHSKIHAQLEKCDVSCLSP